MQPLAALVALVTVTLLPQDNVEDNSWLRDGYSEHFWEAMKRLSERPAAA